MVSGGPDLLGWFDATVRTVAELVYQLPVREPFGARQWWVRLERPTGCEGGLARGGRRDRARWLCLPRDLVQGQLLRVAQR